LTPHIEVESPHAAIRLPPAPYALRS
jgi:hypothetical protein